MSDQDLLRLLDDLDERSGPPRSNGELVFEAPWESRAFGIAVAARDTGLYEWEEFRQELIAAIAEWESAEDNEEPCDYYRHWLASLERVLTEKGAISPEQIDARVAEIQSEAAHEGHDQT